MTQPVDLTTALEGYLGRSVAALTNLSVGWESDVYGFDVQDPVTGRVDPRVLRLYFGQSGGEKAERESAVLRLLRQAGYPVPELFTVESGAAALGRPFVIMARMPGSVLWPLMLRPDATQADSHREQFCRLLLQLHTLDWQALPAEEAARLPRRSVAGQLEFLASFARHYALDEFDAGLEWLAARQNGIAAIPLSLIHWDFHPENVLFAPPDGYAVIDWTQGEISDSRLDLAWTLVLIGTQSSWSAAEHVLSGYVAQGGVAGDDLDFFVAVACLKRLYSVLVSLAYGAEVLGMRPSAEAIMMRHLDRIALVYQRWLEITQLRMAEADRRLAAHL